MGEIQDTINWLRSKSEHTRQELDDLDDWFAGHNTCVPAQEQFIRTDGIQAALELFHRQEYPINRFIDHIEHYGRRHSRKHRKESLKVTYFLRPKLQGDGTANRQVPIEIPFLIKHGRWLDPPQ